MPSKKIKSFAKINIHLNILKKLNSGYHKLETLVMFCNLYDLIYINKNKKDRHKIKFYGKFAKNITTENTISKLLNILDKKKLLDAKYSVNIKKNIPIRSGMGGGSMNAATLLNYFVSNKIIKADKKEIYEIAHKVGSDVVIGIYNKNKTLNYKESKVFFLKKKKIHLLIVKPNFGCNTTKIYSMIKSYSKPRISVKKISNIKAFAKCSNDLEMIAFKIYPKLRELKNTVLNLPNIFSARMTGSGSTIIGYFLTKKDALKGAKIIKKKYKKYWCILSKTI